MGTVLRRGFDIFPTGIPVTLWPGHCISAPALDLGSSCACHVWPQRMLPRGPAPAQGTCLTATSMAARKLRGPQQAQAQVLSPPSPPASPPTRKGGADVTRPAFLRRAAACLRGPALPGGRAFSEPDRSALTSRLVLHSCFFPLSYKLKRHRNSL